MPNFRNPLLHPPNKHIHTYETKTANIIKSTCATLAPKYFHISIYLALGI